MNSLSFDQVINQANQIVFGGSHFLTDHLEKNVALEAIDLLSDFYLNSTDRPSASWRPISFSLNTLIDAYVIFEDTGYLMVAAKVALWVVSVLTLFAPTLLVAAAFYVVDQCCDEDTIKLRMNYDEANDLENHYRSYLNTGQGTHRTGEGLSGQTVFANSHEKAKFCFVLHAIAKDVFCLNAQGKGQKVIVVGNLGMALSSSFFPASERTG